MKRRRSLPDFSVLFFGLILLGCDGENAPSNINPGSTSKPITPLGGSVSYGNAEIIIPAGALSSTTVITIAVPDAPPTYTSLATTAQIGQLYQFGPNATQFNSEVSIYFEYSDAALGSYLENTLQIATFSAAGDTPVVINDLSVNETDNVVFGKTNHLSYFLLLISTE